MSDEDKSLEDFFAKKAKGKKQKGKSKFTTSDAITKQVGSGQKETDSRSKDQPGKKASGVATTPSNPVRIQTYLMTDWRDGHNLLLSTVVNDRLFGRLTWNSTRSETACLNRFVIFLA